MPGQKTPPPPAEPPLSAAEVARRALGRVGGVASVQHLAAALGRRPRQVRDDLKGSAPAVRYLGAGYFALEHALTVPVLDFAQRWLQQRPRHTAPAAALVDAVLDAYPRGDGVAVRRWVQQEPGPLQYNRSTDTVRLLPQRWRQPRR